MFATSPGSATHFSISSGSAPTAQQAITAVQQLMAAVLYPGFFNKQSIQAAIHVVATYTNAQ